MMTMQKERSELLTLINSTTFRRGLNFQLWLDNNLKNYELALEKAVSEGFRFDNMSDNEGREKWNILQAVFFSSTVLTTIGYGNIVPETKWGQLFCIPFAMIGIPLTLTVVSDWGKLFASAVSRLAKHLPAMPERCRKSFRKAAVRRALYISGAICALCLYLAAGATVFLLWEKEWTFFDGFYFCFVTMTTIGFGDLVPTRPNYMLLCTLYILIGMALTSTFIELIRRQYAESWRRIAQAMSGPLLAEGLKKLMMAQNNAADVASLQRILTVSMPRRTKSLRSKDIDSQEWEDAMRAVLRDIQNSNSNKIIQIVVYESSV
ncbi:TWiK family of potassium channels protein 7-like [Ctenocephalides felis]|uniref:TWiK family of potassium channels protein 7-like n=1 Tax=Ctenocephalides felis TaxID=7515 RepID=UPI000E6E30F5|nr:TWiK family of potassium channels protein 7-like [Ctenocephalides felis]